jgi:diguanylate cyclase (GGDEF)-like protein
VQERIGRECRAGAVLLLGKNRKFRNWTIPAPEIRDPKLEIGHGPTPDSPICDFGSRISGAGIVQFQNLLFRALMAKYPANSTTWWWTPVKFIAFEDVFLLGVEILVTSAFLLGLFRLRHKLGLVPFYMALGAMQQLQTLLALTVYVQVVPGMAISPGSTVLFTGMLFTILLVYIHEDASEARKLIYGLLAANLSIAFLSFLIGMHLNSPSLINPFALRQEIFFQGFRVMVVGTFALVIDVFLILILYEAVAQCIRSSLFLRIYVSMFLVLTIDTLLFVTGSFVEQSNYWAVLRAAVLGKLLTAALYSAILTGYFRFLPRDAFPVRNEPGIGLRDLFDVLTYRQRYEAIRTQFHRDPLTGIYNRGFFEDCLHRQLVQDRRNGSSTTLVMIDLDIFKELNDTFGHQFGDHMLVIAGQTLQECLRSTDFPCRYGGDEFVAILSNSSIDAAVAVAQRFQSDLQLRFRSEFSGLSTYRVTATVGIASAPRDGSEPRSLVRAADRRLYSGKKRGRNCIVYDERISEADNVFSPA